MKVLVKAVGSCHHSIEDMQSKDTNLCVSKSKRMAYDILHYVYMIFMSMNQLRTDFRVVKLTHGVSVHTHTHTYTHTHIYIYIFIYLYLYIHDHTQTHHTL